MEVPPRTLRYPLPPVRRLRKPLIALVVLLVLLGGLELLLRASLGGRLQLGPARDALLRDPSAYADLRNEDAFWKLLVQFDGQPEILPTDRLDPVLGWKSELFAQETYEHVDAASLGGRRPVLMFGDSFTRCVTPREECWAALLEESDLARDYAVLNYGVLGYGLDQVRLLVEAVLPLYRDLDPIVVVGILVDDDLDRCLLRFRGWPKPRYVAEGGELRLELPPTLDRTAYLAQHPPAIASYLLRRVLRSAALPVGLRRRLDGSAAREREAREISELLLRDLGRLLDEAGVEHFAMLHVAASAVGDDWRERFVIETLENFDIPFVSGHTVLRARATRTGHHLARYFLKEGDGAGHYNGRGNRVVFEALRAGLEGRFESYDAVPSRDPDPGAERRAERRREAGNAADESPETP